MSIGTVRAKFKVTSIVRTQLAPAYEQIKIVLEPQSGF